MNLLNLWLIMKGKTNEKDICSWLIMLQYISCGLMLIFR